jgi:ERCC4-type nuclease
MILVDSREPVAIASYMKDVTRVTLPDGDYVFFSHDGKKVIVERKTPGDLLTSFQTGRFQDQVKRVVGDADYPFLLIEGHMFATKDGFVKFGSQELRWLFTSVQNILVTAQLTGMYMLFSDNNEGTARVIESLYEYFQKEEHLSIMRPKVFKIFDDDVTTVRESIVSMVPGFGPELAKRLIERFGTPIEVFLADEGLLTSVKGVGKSKFNKMVEIVFPKAEEGNNE